MRATLSDRLEAGRLGREAGIYASEQGSGPTGAFRVQGPCGAPLRIIASDGGHPDSAGWEHVSVSCAKRTPNWTEMSFVKGLFWDDEECVVEFHPPRSTYVANHPYVLHLWRNVAVPFPTPPEFMVGWKSIGELTKEEGEMLRRLGELMGEPPSESLAAQALERFRAGVLA